MKLKKISVLTTPTQQQMWKEDFRFFFLFFFFFFPAKLRNALAANSLDKLRQFSMEPYTVM